jgi:hypothetical protein
MHTMAKRQGKSGTINIKAVVAEDEEFLRVLVRAALVGQWLHEKIELESIHAEIWKDAAPAHLVDVAVFCDSDASPMSGLNRRPTAIAPSYSIRIRSGMANTPRKPCWFWRR